MENPSRQILDEIAALIASVKSRLSLVEEKLAELSSYAQVHGQEPEQENSAAEGHEEVPSAADPQEPDAGPSFRIDAGDLLKEAEHLVYETGYAEDAGHVEEMSGPVPEQEHEPEPEPVHNHEEHLAVMDVLAEKEAWKKDRPGFPVKDVRSAISLNDRALFIRSLFREDPLLFSETLARINSMQTLDQVEAGIRHEFPEWNMESEVVYRFMMCVRRKVG